MHRELNGRKCVRRRCFHWQATLPCIREASMSIHAACHPSEASESAVTQPAGAALASIRVSRLGVPPGSSRGARYTPAAKTRASEAFARATVRHLFALCALRLLAAFVRAGELWLDSSFTHDPRSVCRSIGRTEVLSTDTGLSELLHDWNT